jgi:hypothetical protein
MDYLFHAPKNIRLPVEEMHKEVSTSLLLVFDHEAYEIYLTRQLGYADPLRLVADLRCKPLSQRISRL